ncbi:MAG: carbohydrate ABC transporter permease [Aeropyrum sp.]|nr:carbohydrate ABC transporter permease [Aeropyrum sp.]MCE4616781.1 carbohydrate ABC transporter permease [Aeropyrum sp.]
MRLKHVLRPAVIISNLVAWLVALLWLLPFVGLFMTSTRPFEEVVLQGWWSLAGNYTLANYVEVLTDPQYDLATGFKNSFIVALPSTLAPLLIAALAAYAFSRFSFTMRNLLFVTILVIMAIPQQTMVIPLFFLLKSMGLLDQLLGVILIHSSWGIAWITFFMRNYFSMLPRDVEEAARVDGASYATIFFRIILPLSLPALAAAAAIQFTWVWADFFFALIFLYSPENMVITQKVVTIKGQYQIDWGLLSAGSILAMIPPVLVYAALQKYYLRGMAGWVTGKG